MSNNLLKMKSSLLILPSIIIWIAGYAQDRKPAGQGTGLGLSLAYDIVKAHGGEIEG